MTRLIAAVFALMLATAAPAQDARAPAIEGVIQSQIDAFLKDDFATAFSFASPTIKQMFGTSDNFGAMVMSGYPMVWRPSGVEFGELREENGLLIQRVTVTDGGGRAWDLDYHMIEAGAGWQINGVFLLRAAGTGV